MTNRFKDWTVTKYTATSPNGKCILWVAGGFLFFKDNGDAQNAVLIGLSLWQKWKVWRELKKEMTERAFPKNL